jgi:hypothetical protein
MSDATIDVGCPDDSPKCVALSGSGIAQDTAGAKCIPVCLNDKDGFAKDSGCSVSTQVCVDEAGNSFDPDTAGQRCIAPPCVNDFGGDENDTGCEETGHPICIKNDLKEPVHDAFGAKCAVCVKSDYSDATTDAMWVARTALRCALILLVRILLKIPLDSSAFAQSQLPLRLRPVRLSITSSPTSYPTSSPTRSPTRPPIDCIDTSTAQLCVHSNSWNKRMLCMLRPP